MSASTVLPDAAATNWVDRHAPPALRPWLKLGRFDRPAGIWLLMLPGWQGIALAAPSRAVAQPLAAARLLRRRGPDAGGRLRLQRHRRPRLRRPGQPHRHAPDPGRPDQRQAGLGCS
jgi:hypothetical protein